MVNPEIFTTIYRAPVYIIPTRLLVVIDKPWASFTNDELLLLEKILRALHTTTDAVTIKEISEFALDTLQDTSAVLIFSSNYDASLPLYECSDRHDVRIVKSAPLSELTEDLKRKLWIALKMLLTRP